MLGHYLELLLASLSVLWRENLTAPLNPNSSFFSFYCGLSLLNGFNLLIPSHSENRKQRLFIVKAAYHQEMQILDAIIFQDSFFYFFSSDAFYPYHLSRTFPLGFSPFNLCKKEKVRTQCLKITKVISSKPIWISAPKMQEFFICKTFVLTGDDAARHGSAPRSAVPCRVIAHQNKNVQIRNVRYFRLCSVISKHCPTGNFHLKQSTIWPLSSHQKRILTILTFISFFVHRAFSLFSVVSCAHAVPVVVRKRLPRKKVPAGSSLSLLRPSFWAHIPSICILPNCICKTTLPFSWPSTAWAFFTWSSYPL